MEKWSPCPDFELEPLSKFDPKIFDWDTKDPDLRDLYSLIITLALIFNDFKDLAWWHKQLNKHPPEKQELNPYVGQHNGMNIHISRLVLGLYRELLKLIEENSIVLRSKFFKEILGRISAKNRNDWKKLIEQASDKELVRKLEDLRSNGVYHYVSIRGLFNGYKNAFENKTSELNVTACYSFSGKNFSTRFYFADAPTAGYAEKFGDKKIEYLLLELSIALKSIVFAGIKFCESKHSAIS